MSTPEKPRPPFEPGHTSGTPYRELPSVTNRPAVGATPRPSYDDTLAHIDAALAEEHPWKPPTTALDGDARRQLFEQAAARVAADRRIEEATAPRTPEPGPGWLARLLDRLFG